jgi:hypothetical protein
MVRGDFFMKKLSYLFLAGMILLSFTGCNTGNSSKRNAASPTATPVGWPQTETKYFISANDLDVKGGPVESSMTGTGDRLFDYYQDEVKPGDITLSHSRKDASGKVQASVQWEIIWTAPADYLPAGVAASFDAEHKTVESLAWTPPAVTATFDQPDMDIGKSSASPNRFHQPNGSQGTYRDTREEVIGMKATMTTENPIAAGKAGDRMAIYITFGEGYGMRYTYEWR